MFAGKNRQTGQVEQLGSFPRNPVGLKTGFGRPFLPSDHTSTT
jgi:hypothetical protein